MLHYPTQGRADKKYALRLKRTFYKSKSKDYDSYPAQIYDNIPLPIQIVVKQHRNHPEQKNLFY
jgi:hypothetical protein